MKKYCFGIDIGGTSIKIGLFTEDGMLRDKWSIPTNLTNKGKYILENIAATIQNKMDKIELTKDMIMGIGVGVPGPVLSDGTVNKCVNLGWDIYNVRNELEKLTDIKVKVENDANIAALGEQFKGGGEGYKNLLMVTLGTGVGGGIIINGNIVSGANGAGGEIGHMKISDSEEEPCSCGNYGCLEQYTSATGIVRSTKKALLSKNDDLNMSTVLKGKVNLTAEDVFNAAKEGDCLARMMVEDLGNMLGKALAQIACIVNPEIFVIGGGVSKAGDILMSTVTEYFTKYAFHATTDTKFSLAKLGNDAGIYGGAKLIIG